MQQAGGNKAKVPTNLSEDDDIEINDMPYHHHKPIQRTFCPNRESIARMREIEGDNDAAPPKISRKSKNDKKQNEGSDRPW